MVELICKLPQPHRGQVMDAVFNSDDSCLATAGFDGTTKNWNLATAEELVECTGGLEPIQTVTFGGKGDEFLITTSADGTVKVWDARRGQLYAPLSLPDEKAKVAISTSDGSFVAIGYESGALTLWDLYSGKPLKTFRDHYASIASMRFLE